MLVRERKNYFKVVYVKYIQHTDVARKVKKLSRVEENCNNKRFSQKRKKNTTHIKIDNFAFENVENFNYLGSILNEDNKMNIKTAGRIAKGYKAYYANVKLIKKRHF